ncbi:MAG: GntR family transcriptional regulator [Rhizorhabdus sp.]
MSERGNTALQTAAERLRRLSLAAVEGDLLGGEDALIATLGFSRSTIRQAARLLEREGLVRVKRGPAGGYFACRPDATTIEMSVSAYLETLDMDIKDINNIASALWVEAVRKAAALGGDGARDLADRFIDRVQTTPATASFTTVTLLEQESRSAIFAFADSRYVELIFNINTAFALRAFAEPLAPAADKGAEHLQFVRAWRRAKTKELTALGDGDEELAVLAARHSRKVWDERIWTRRGLL